MRRRTAKPYQLGYFRMLKRDGDHATAYTFRGDINDVDIHYDPERNEYVVRVTPLDIHDAHARIILDEHVR